MGTGVFVKEAGGAVVRALSLNLTFQTIQLLVMQLYSDAGAGCLQLKENEALSVQPDSEHGLFWWSAAFAVVFESSLGGPDNFSWLDVGVGSPRLTTEDKGVEPGLGGPERGHKNCFLGTAVALHLGQLERYPLRQLGHKD